MELQQNPMPLPTASSAMDEEGDEEDGEDKEDGDEEGNDGAEGLRQGVEQMEVGSDRPRRPKPQTDEDGWITVPVKHHGRGQGGADGAEQGER